MDNEKADLSNANELVQRKSNTTSDTVGLTNEEEELMMESSKVNFRLAFFTFIIAFGSSFQFVMNAPESFIIKWMGTSHKHLFGRELNEAELNLLYSSAVSLFAAGGMIGGLLVGKMADRFGRKRSLHWCNLLSILAAGMMINAYLWNCYPLFHAGRFIIGINAGLVSGIVPMLLVELSPIKLRGSFGSISQCVVTISILIAQILGLPYIFGTQTLWPLMFAFILVPSILQVIGLYFVPESPKYTFMFLDDPDKAFEDLAKVRNIEVAKLELKMYEFEKGKNLDKKNLSIKQVICSRELRWPLLLAVLLMAFQQLSGINAAMFYSTKIFKDAGLEGEMAVYATIFLTTLNVLTTLLSLYLVDHPRIGRRILLLLGKAGMAVSLTCLVVSMALVKRGIAANILTYFSMIFLPMFVFFFACGPGSIPFFYVNEIFYSDSRGAANSVAVGFNWTFNFIVSLSFLIIKEYLQEFTFLIFTAVCLIAFVFIIVFLPETKSKSIADVQIDLKGRQPKCFD